MTPTIFAFWCLLVLVLTMVFNWIFDPHHEPDDGWFGVKCVGGACGAATVCVMPFIVGWISLVWLAFFVSIAKVVQMALYKGLVSDPAFKGDLESKLCGSKIGGTIVAMLCMGMMAAIGSDAVEEGEVVPTKQHDRVLATTVLPTNEPTAMEQYIEDRRAMMEQYARKAEVEVLIAEQEYKVNMMRWRVRVVDALVKTCAQTGNVDACKSAYELTLRVDAKAPESVQCQEVVRYLQQGEWK